LLGLVSIVSSKFHLIYSGLLDDILWNVCDRFHPIAIILVLTLLLLVFGRWHAARAILAISTLYGLLYISSSGVNLTYSGLSDEIMSWSLCGRIRPMGVIIGISMLILYLVYMIARTRFIKAWMASKVV